MRLLFQRIGVVLCLFLPLLAFAESITPLGVLLLGEQSVVELPFSNAGQASVHIRHAETSCECLTPEFTEAEIGPGETKKLRFSYRPISAGRMRVDISYFASDAAQILKTESVTGVVVQKEWTVGMGELHAGVARNEVVVDLRRTEAFQAAHIPRSLNLPLFALRLHSELKAKEIILIDEGFAPATLAEEALRLRASGFAKVRFANRGIAEWIRTGGAVEGSSPSAVRAALISPADFTRAQRTDTWNVLLLPLSANDRPSAQKSPTNGNARLLVVARGESEYAKFENEHASNAGAFVFYLSGGAAALEKYKSEQARMASNPGAVFQSKSLQPHVVANTGCGTCPKSRP